MSIDEIEAQCYTYISYVTSHPAAFLNYASQMWWVFFSGMMTRTKFDNDWNWQKTSTAYFLSLYYNLLQTETLKLFSQLHTYQLSVFSLTQWPVDSTYFSTCGKVSNKQRPQLIAGCPSDKPCNALVFCQVIINIQCSEDIH